MDKIRARYAKEQLLHTTLVFLLRGDGENPEVLLAMKKRGFGKGQWNGAGGKIEPGESSVDAARREVQEEIGVQVGELKQAATMEFYLASDHADYPTHVRCDVYVCLDWAGEPSESEEMAPQWFGVRDVPYDQMWPDDRFWLPHVLAGAVVEGVFELGRDNALRAWQVVSRKG